MQLRGDFPVAPRTRWVAQWEGLVPAGGILEKGDEAAPGPGPFLTVSPTGFERLESLGRRPWGHLADLSEVPQHRVTRLLSSAPCSPGSTARCFQCPPVLL